VKNELENKKEELELKLKDALDSVKKTASKLSDDIGKKL